MSQAFQFGERQLCIPEKERLGISVLEAKDNRDGP